MMRCSRSIEALRRFSNHCGGAAIRRLLRPARIRSWLGSRARVLFDKRREFPVAIEPVAVGADTIGWHPNISPEIRRQFVLVEWQRCPPLCADDDSQTSGKSVAELHHTAGANAGEIDDDESSAVQSLKDLDVHESPLWATSPHLPRREAAILSYGIDDVAEETLDARIVLMVGR